MRTLLVAANRERSPFPVAPIGALSVASAARVAGFEVDLIDLSIVRAPARALRTALRTNHYDAVGLSIRNLDNCLYARPRSYFDDIAWIVCELRRASDAPLILGGSGFSIAPREWLVRLDADYGAVGEGEHTFVALLRRLAGKESTRGLDGVISREDVMEARCHRCPVYIDDLDALPKPAHQQCHYAAHVRRGGFVSIQTKRGCPCNCIYCVYPLLEGTRFRLRSPERVADEMASVIAEQDVHWFFFTDGVFNMPAEHAMDMCHTMAQRRLPVRWMAYCNPVGFDRELARAMVAAGCAGVEFGLDAAVEKMLVGLGKPFSQADIHSALEAAAFAELPVAVHLLFGGPGENADDVRETQRFLDTCAPVHAVFASVGLRVYENTPLHALARREGALVEDRDLFEPTYYVSPELGEDPMAIVDAVVRQRPEWTSPTDWMKLSLRVIQYVVNRVGGRPQWRNVRNYGKYMRR